MAHTDIPLQNDLLLRSLRGECVERPPVWMMRQAGRYLPDFGKLRGKYTFVERCRNPEIATEIAVMTVDQIGVNAAIIFSDILVVPQAMGQVVEMNEGAGPVLPDPIRGVTDLDHLHVPDVQETLGYVFEALRLTRQKLAGRVPLIGFARVPWTLLCYMVEDAGLKTFDIARAFYLQQPALAQRLLRMLTDTTIAYLTDQVAAGADCVQIFDSWGGLLSPADFAPWSQPWLVEIASALRECPLQPE